MAKEQGEIDFSALSDELKRVDEELAAKDIPAARKEIKGVFAALEPLVIRLYLKGGSLASGEGDYLEAQGLFTLAAAISRRIGDSENELFAIASQLYLVRTGRNKLGFAASLSDAYPLRVRGKEILKELPQGQGVLPSMHFLIESALIERVRENRSRSLDLLDQALIIGETALDQLDEIDIMLLLGRIHLIKGDIQSERGFSVHTQTEYEQGYEYFRMALDKPHMGEAALALAEIYEHRRDAAQALLWYDLALKTAYDAHGTLINEEMARLVKTKIAELSGI